MTVENNKIPQIRQREKYRIKGSDGAMEIGSNLREKEGTPDNEATKLKESIVQLKEDFQEVKDRLDSLYQDLTADERFATDAYFEVVKETINSTQAELKKNTIKIEDVKEELAQKQGEVAEQRFGLAEEYADLYSAYTSAGIGDKEKMKPELDRMRAELVEVGIITTDDEDDSAIDEVNAFVDKVKTKRIEETEVDEEPQGSEDEQFARKFKQTVKGHIKTAQDLLTTIEQGYTYELGKEFDALDEQYDELEKQLEDRDDVEALQTILEEFNIILNQIDDYVPDDENDDDPEDEGADDNENDDDEEPEDERADGDENDDDDDQEDERADDDENDDDSEGDDAPEDENDDDSESDNTPPENQPRFPRLNRFFGNVRKFFTGLRRVTSVNSLRNDYVPPFRTPEPPPVEKEDPRQQIEDEQRGEKEKLDGKPEADITTERERLENDIADEL